MIREILNRNQVEKYPPDPEDSYFPVQPSNTVFNREISISRRDLSLRNFACLDFDTNKLYLNFDALQDYRDDRINFVSVIGYQQNGNAGNKEGHIDISQQPLIIINGIQYFLLKAECCSIDILKILYTLSESIYVSDKFMGELENNMGKVVDLSETWDIRNYLYVVSRHFQSSSQYKTTAETRELQDFQDPEKMGGKFGKSVGISGSLEKYFSDITVIPQPPMFEYYIFTVKDNIEHIFNLESSRWYTYEAIIRGCTKILTGSKALAMKQFHKINTAIILDQFQQRVLNNYHIFSFQTIRSFNNRKKDYAERVFEEEIGDGDKEREREIEREREKERQKEKEKLKKLKKNILLPFNEAEEMWIGKADAFRQRYLELRQKIEQQYEKVLSTMNEADQTLMNNEIDRMASHENCLQALGSSKFDGLTLKFPNFLSKMKTYLAQSIKSNFTNKKWVLKDKSSNNRDNLLSNLDSRIEINQRKKEGLEMGIKLAMKEYQYLKAMMLTQRRDQGSNRLAFEISK